MQQPQLPVPWRPNLTPPNLPPIFDDINQNSWYVRYVTAVTSAGVFQGTGVDQFSPDETMTRAMFVQVFANLEGVDLLAFSNSIPDFTDVSPDDWYFGAVEWAASLGIVSGLGEGIFALNTPISREQLAVMLFRFIQIMGIEIPMRDIVTFINQDTISP